MTGTDSNHGTSAKIISIQMLLAWEMVTLATLTQASVITATRTISMTSAEAILVDSGEEVGDVIITMQEASAAAVTTSRDSTTWVEIGLTR